MPEDAFSSLSSGVQDAFQQAVNDVPDAANLHPTTTSKRARDERDATRDEDGAAAKKKKSSAQHDALVGEIATVTPSEIVMQASASAADAPVAMQQKQQKKTQHSQEKENGGGQMAQAAITQETENVAQSTQEHAQSNGPPITDLPASSEEFLSAVVAAASATANQPLQQQPPAPEPQYDPNISPAPYMPYTQGYAPLPYPPPLGHPPPGPLPSGYGHPSQPPPLFPDPAGLIESLNFASSEDFLRALQEFDLSKVMNVLRSLGEAASVANASATGQPAYMAPPPSDPPPINQQPARSEAILSRPPGQNQTDQAPAQSTATSSAATDRAPNRDNPGHAYMLANAWMSAAKLADLVQKEGLVYKKGKFSAIEEAQLNAAIEKYRVTRGLTPEQINEIIFAKERGRDTFWPEITAALHLRPITAVYHHVRRTRHPLGNQGKWMPSEDELLIQAVTQFGQQWEKVSQKVGRMSSDCRDRWRNHLQDRGTRQTGAWTKEEEEELTRIVTEMIIEKGKDTDNDIFWGVVSQRMGGRRGRQQCRIKWTDTLSTQIKNQGERPRWSQMDAYILVHKVDSLNARDDSEIDWKLLPDQNWNFWSAHALQRRWVTMKKSIKGYEEMSHAEIVEILKSKKSVPPPPTGRKRKKVTSAEEVDDVEAADELPDEIAV